MALNCGDIGIHSGMHNCRDTLTIYSFFCVHKFSAVHSLCLDICFTLNVCNNVFGFVFRFDTRLFCGEK